MRIRQIFTDYNGALFMFVIGYHSIFAYVAYFLSLGLGFYLMHFVPHVVAIVFLFLFSDKITHIFHKTRDSSDFMEDEKFLIDLFDTVYGSAKINHRDMPKKVKIYISDSPNENAFALLNSIIITRGMLNSFSHDELKGVIAHELGHIYLRHPHLLIFLRGAFIIGTLYLFMYRNAIHSTVIVRFVITFFLLFPSFIYNIVANSYFRDREFDADKFAAYIGYKHDLIGALKQFYKSELVGYSFFESLYSPHPATSLRIVRLEARRGI